MSSLTPPIAASGRELNGPPRPIPRAVKASIVMMVHEAVDFIVAAKAHDLRPDTLRRWLHRPEVAAFVREERRAYRLAISCGNEHALAEVRDNREGNQMARVAATKAIHEIDHEETTRGAGDQMTAGITIQIVHVPPDAGSMVDVTPKPVPLTDSALYRKP